MKLYGISKEDNFKEYKEIEFHSEHREELLEDWLEKNPDDILEDGQLLVIGRQVMTNLGSIIDLLAVDRQGDIAVVELKRNRTPRDTLAQALEYASFVQRLGYDQIEDIFRSYTNDDSENLAQYHQEYFDLGTDEGIAFNSDQRLVIVGQNITSEIRQTSSFLRLKGIRVTCLEFGFFKSTDGQRLLSTDVVVGKEPATSQKIISGSAPIITKAEFIESLDRFGKPVFEKILDFAELNGYPIHWGTKGFSLNVNINGTHVVVCFGYHPAAVYKQSVYTAILGHGGLLTKTKATEEEAAEILKKAEDTGLFITAGRERKCLINEEFSPLQIEKLVNWIEQASETIMDFDLPID